jgi:hypothetical protein
MAAFAAFECINAAASGTRSAETYPVGSARNQKCLLKLRWFSPAESGGLRSSCFAIKVFLDCRHRATRESGLCNSRGFVVRTANLASALVAPTACGLAALTDIHRVSGVILQYQLNVRD